MKRYACGERNGRARAPDGDVALAIELYDTTRLSIAEIARKLQAPRRTVSGWIHGATRNRSPDRRAV